MDYNFESDKLDRRGFISKELILDYLTQEQIFELVFGFIPKEFDYVRSPFRKDRTPGCYFEYTVDGRLRFKDFGNPSTVMGIRMRNIDCFDAVRIFFSIPNFYQGLEFIFNHLIKGKDIIATKKVEAQIERSEKKQVKILAESREFRLIDYNFWNPYEFKKEHLLEDKVFPVSKYHLLNSKAGSYSSVVYDACYMFTDFPEGRKKLYFPHREKSRRFISTCTRNDIGGTRSLVTYGRTLIITKSYKDWRVLKNNGKHAIWFQNEGMVPDLDELIMLVKRFKKIIVWFDNDEAGITASQNIAAIINSILPGRAVALWLPENLCEIGITDPSDLLHKQGRPTLTEFLNLKT